MFPMGPTKGFLLVGVQFHSSLATDQSFQHPTVSLQTELTQSQLEGIVTVPVFMASPLCLLSDKLVKLFRDDPALDLTSDPELTSAHSCSSFDLLNRWLIFLLET